MTKKNLLIATILSSLLISTAAILATENSSSLLKAEGNPQGTYKLSLNDTTTKLTLEEGGSWDDQRPLNSPFVRKTSLGNDVNFRFSGSRSLTSVDNNFCIARNSGGWIANESPISGIEKIEIKAQAGQTIRFDFSDSQPLNTYTYDEGAIPSYVNYHTDPLTGSSTYTIVPDSNQYSYFRFQQISSGNNWIKSIDIYYSCVPSHEHNWIHHDAETEYHEHNGNIEYESCSICGKMRNMDHQYVTEDEVFLEPVIYNLPFNGDAVTLNTVVPTTGIQSFDFKITDPSKRFIVLLMYDWSNYIGKNGGIEFTNTTSGELFAGATVTQMTDGWTRLTIDFSKLNIGYRVEGTVPEIRSIFVDNRYSTTGALCEVNSKATNVYRGLHYLGQVDNTKSLSSSEYVSFTDLIINVDILWEGKKDPSNNNYLRLMIAGDWSNYFGYYEITPETKTGDFEGVTVSSCKDGYTRYSFFCNKCDLVAGTRPTTLKFFYLHKWSNQTGWVDYTWSTHTHDLVHTPAVEPFRENDGNIEYYTCQDPICGAVLNENYEVISASEIVDPSRLQRYEAYGDDLSYHFDTPILAGQLVSIDFLPDDPQQPTCIALFETEQWDSYRGYYSFFGDGTYSGTQEEGISVSKLLDGYIRVTFDMTKLYKWNTQTASQGLSQVKWIYIRGDWTHTSGYIDFNVHGGTVARGLHFDAQNGLTFDFDHTLSLSSTINVDLMITSGENTHTTWMIGNWSNYYGYWNFYMDHSDPESITGVTRTVLSDGYVRYTFDMAQIIAAVGKQYDLKLFYIRGNNWSDASGWVDISVVESIESPIMEDIY